MKLLFFMGKGGVGKSTLSAITAVQLASINKKVRLVSIDPAHNLMDIFSPEKTKETLHFSRNLTIQELDIEKEKHHYIKQVQQEIKQEFKQLASLNLDTLIDTLSYTPGVEEYVILNSFSKIVQNDKTDDFIIFDTPPTALTLRILTLPLLAEQWIEKLQKIRKQILQSRRSLNNVYGEKEFKEKYGQECALNIPEDPIYQRLTKLHGNHEQLAAKISSKDSYVVPVVNPDRLSLKETERISTYLKRFRISPAFMVINKFNNNHQLPELLKKQYKTDIYTIQAETNDFYCDPAHLDNTKTEFIERLLK